MKPRIAIVGTGIAGMTAGYRLRNHADLTLFEADSRPGGHADTFDVEDPNGPLAIDTGFIVCNPDNYPTFMALLDELGVKTQPSAMSFSVRRPQTGLEWESTGLGGLFANRRNLVSPRVWLMLKDMLKFHRVGLQDQPEIDDQCSVSEYLDRHRLGKAFRDDYLVPFGAAVWSCSGQAFLDFPIKFVLDFMKHHRMLAIRGRPKWRTVEGGSRTYVRALMQHLPPVHFNAPVDSIQRDEDGVTLVTQGNSHRFDEVILACHADQSLAMLEDADDDEISVLSSVPFRKNTARLHSDSRALPSNRRCHAAWNFRSGDPSGTPPSITYGMNILQNLPAAHDWSVTLNDVRDVAPETVARTVEYEHPEFMPGSMAARRRQLEFCRRRRTSFCGAWWGWGFHEDGCASGQAVAAAFGACEPPLLRAQN